MVLRINARLHIIGLLALFSLATFCDMSAGAEKAEPVFIVWSDTHQTIVGFGGSMGWIHPHPDQREEIYDLLFKQ
jgi:hypothetical protein